MTKVKENSELTQELELRDENSAIVQPGESRLPFGIAGGNGAGVNKEELSQIANADNLDFDMKGEYWTPQAIGERKRMVFQHLVKGEMIANKYGANPDEMVPVDTAYFIEVYKEGDKVKQQMIRSCATVIVSFLERNRVPKHAILDIEYKGKKRGEKFQFDDFKFIPVINKAV